MKIRWILASLIVFSDAQLFKGFKKLLPKSQTQKITHQISPPQDCEISVVSIQPSHQMMISSQIEALHNKFDSVCSSSRAEAKKALGSRLFRPKDNYVIGNQNDIKGWNNIRKGNNGIITGDNNIILNEQ